MREVEIQEEELFFNNSKLGFSLQLIRRRLVKGLSEKGVLRVNKKRGQINGDVFSKLFFSKIPITFAASKK